MDAFQAFAEGRMIVHENVFSVLSRQHSETPNSNRYRHALMGPYRGLVATRRNHTDYKYFDYYEYPDSLLTRHPEQRFGVIKSDARVSQMRFIRTQLNSLTMGQFDDVRCVFSAQHTVTQKNE